MLCFLVWEGGPLKPWHIEPSSWDTKNFKSLTNNLTKKIAIIPVKLTAGWPFWKCLCGFTQNTLCDTLDQINEALSIQIVLHRHFMVIEMSTVKTLLFPVTLHAHVLWFIWSPRCLVCIVMPAIKTLVTVHLPSWEEAFRCSSRSHPNTFSLFPPFLRTLLISSCWLFPLHIQTGPGCSACGRQTVRVAAECVDQLS